ncbi:MAG: hypothetical protein WBC33_05955 [Conexibacter sp.]
MRRRLAAQDGFTLIAVLGILAAGMSLSIAAFAAAGGDVHLSRNDEDQKRAYAAAEAGVQDYFFHLTQDNAYWAKCDSPSPAHPALNQPGASPLKTRAVPGSNASYAIELLPANGHTACNTNDATASMIVAAGGPMSGTFSIRATGFSNGVKRKIVATFRRRSFLDYLYFTDLETSDPAWYVLSANGYPTRSGTSNWSGFTPSTKPDLLTWAAANCPRYWRNSRSSQRFPVSPDNAWQKQINGTWGSTSTSTVSCTEIQFVSGDHIDGPLHTNDDILICGAPTFGRTTQDSIEVSGSGWRQGCGSGGPNILGTWKPNSPVLTPPPSDTSLKQVVDPSYLFKGTTTIVLQDGQMTVTNANLNPTTQTIAFPSNGVVYVDHDPVAGCAVSAYQPLAPYSDPAGCGDAYVKGTYSADLTIATAKDIVVNGNVARNGDKMLGLIANNFVRVYHPVSPDPSNPNDKTDCVNQASTPTNVSIDAAILALNHSFTVDSYFCGSPLGTLTIRGTIAQKHRGPVGRGSGSTITSGYYKDYEYDDRLRLREPPHFIDPVQASWRIQRYAEQVG